MQISEIVEVYVETGKKRTFAGAVEWPGWCRSGKDQDAAVQALCDYAGRYSKVMKAAGIDFRVPESVGQLKVVETLVGNATTDFGAPGIPPSSDSRRLDEAGLARLEALLQACWRAFDKKMKTAAGKELRKGPRGGGRELAAIVQHVVGADAAYLSAMGGKFRTSDSGDARKDLLASRKAILAGLEAAAHNQVPKRGPRGGKRWSPRYFVRRSAWHILDHAWEIEDRSKRA